MERGASAGHRAAPKLPAPHATDAPCRSVTGCEPPGTAHCEGDAARTACAKGGLDGGGCSAAFPEVVVVVLVVMLVWM